MPIKQSVKIFKALANSRRVEILRILSTGQRLNVLDLSEKLDLAFKSTSKHLQILINSDFLYTKREGRNCFYYFNKNLPELRSNLSTLIN